jgi:hypothetical protein
MPKFTTIYRTIVMVVAAVIAVEGWQRYGPSHSQVRSLATRALEIAHDALNTPKPRPEERPGLAPATAGIAHPFSTAQQPAAIGSTPGGSGEIPRAPEIFAPAAPEQPIVETSIEPPDATAAGTDRLSALMNRLEQLGGVEPRLVSWGSGGQLYRFCCQAALEGAPNVKRHFESVAPERTIAVEEVVAKVEAWRAAQHDRSDPR